MALFHGNAIPSGDAKQEIYAPSSNDWDYTYDGGGEWPVSGNSLGDHTVGGYIDNTGSNSAIYSLFTFDGDFEIEWTLTDENEATWGVHAIDEDDERGTDDDGNMLQMTNSFWRKGESDRDFYIGSSRTNANPTIADGSVIKIERVSGTIKVYDDGSAIHTFGTTYSGTMRFCISAPGSSHDADFDNILFTDSEGVQRDGQINEGISGSDSCGDANASKRHAGFQFSPTRTGTVTEAKVIYASVASAYNATIDIYTDSSGSPGSIIGTASDSTSNSGGGTITYPNISASVVKGTKYWAILNDVTGGGSGSASLGKLTGNTLYGSGLNDTITSITDNASAPYPFEIKIETTEEPTPDWDTLLLIHSDTSDGSTTFVDSSPFGRTASVDGDCQHDTAQKKFGASSILFDGTGDGLNFPDADEWKTEGDFTVDFWVRFASVGGKRAMVNQQAGSGNSNTNFYMQLDTSDKMEFAIGRDGGGSMTSGKPSTTFVADTWYHVAMVVIGSVGQDAGSLLMFVNGTLETTATGDVQGTALSSTLDIGTSLDTSVPHMNGWLDEIRISRVARWDANFTPPTSPYP